MDITVHKAYFTMEKFSVNTKFMNISQYILQHYMPPSYVCGLFYWPINLNKDMGKRL